ncbi:MAG: transporter substrate-binding domain-containing protein [Clostridiales Family XIII bacterium]|jgi:L-cystine transport system substrate-binding protein|nr:transporter substrate-binding domain-containing protein [Clostridiales Family XIII bacterium]
MKKNIKLTALILSIALIASLMLTGCGEKKAEGTDKNAESETEVTTLVVGWVGNGKPITYLGDDGEPTGVDIEALKLVDELLPEYEFDFQMLEQPAVFAGLETGKVDIATTNSFYTKERDEKYLFPEEFLGMNIEGLVINKKYADKVTSLEDAASQGLKLSPFLAGDGNVYVVEQYNNAHPDNQITMELSDNPDIFIQQFAMIAEGRYDYGVIPKQYWETLVKDENADLHEYAKDLEYIEFGAVRTWAIFADGNEKAAAAFDKAVKQLKEEGKLSELAIQFIGYDTWAYVDTPNMY